MDATDPLMQIGAALTALVFALALRLGRRGEAARDRLASWTAGAFTLEAAAVLVSVTVGLGTETGVFLYSALHGLVPVLVLAGAGRQRPGGEQNAVLLALVGITVGGLGTAMVADVPTATVLFCLHVFRAGVFLGAAWLITRALGRRGRAVAGIGATAGVFAAGVALGIGLDALSAGSDPAFAAVTSWAGVLEEIALYGLGLTVLLLPGHTRQDSAIAPRSPEGWADHLMQAMGQAALVVGTDGHVAWANAEAGRLFAEGTRSALLGKDIRLLFPDFGHRITDAPGKGTGVPSSPTARSSLGRTLGGAELGLEITRLPIPGPSGEAMTGVVVHASSGTSLLTGLVHLSRDMDAAVLAGDSAEALCRLACDRLTDIERVPLAWIALRTDRDTPILAAAAGPEAVDLCDGLGGPPPDSLAGTIEPLFRQATLHPFAAPPHAPDGDRRKPGGTGEPIRVAPDGLRPGFAYALRAGDEVLGCLVVHPAGDASDRGLRQRAEFIARRLAIMTKLIRNSSFLRLQATAMTVAANAVFITDDQGRIEWANEAFGRLSGFSPDEIIGKTPHILFSGHQDAATYADMWATIRRGEVWRGELVERRKDNTLYTVCQTVTPITGPDGVSVHYVAVHEDVTERKRAEERIRYMSNYDTLTRLPNRALFRDRLIHVVQQARRTDGTVAVLFVDLTKFSRVNDTLGHDIGDRILMTVGSRINAAVAEDVDTVARMGGDEFAIIQSVVGGADAAATLARRVAKIIETPVEVGGHTVSLRATVGIAMYPDDGNDPDQIIRNADLAMHRVAHHEGEHYRFYSNDINNEAQIRLGLEADLRRALDRDELENFYQPQYDMTGTLVGMEALVRWRHPTRGLVPPGQFIGAAEDSGLILPLGEAVLRRALADIDAWRAHGLPTLPVAVNLSAVQFRDGGLVDRIRESLEAHDLPPEVLDLEITESVLMTDHVGTVAFLNQLTGAGFRIAIDDFGTGYSSLAYLKRFPVHKLKIDQSFVQHLDTDTNDAILVRAIINLGHSLGMTVIAEGVETQAQFEYLRQEGADVVQGYLFSKPIPREEMEDLLRTETGRIGRAAARVGP